MAKSVREMAQELIQYGNKSQKNYSPLNIRALVVSPNGVMVFYHDYQAVHRPYKSCMFKASQVSIEMQQPKYKTITSLLTDPACSAVEEIIYLTQAAEGVDCSYWLQMEQTQKGKNIKWQRLYKEYLMNVNFIQFKQYVDNLIVSDRQIEIRKKLRSGTELITQVFDIPNLSDLKVYNQRWWENWAENFAASQYSMNQSLFNRFTKIKTDIVSAERSSEIQKLKNEREKSKNFESNKKEVEGYLKAVNKYIWVYGLFVNNILKKDNIGFLGDSFVPFSNSFDSVRDRFKFPYIDDLDVSQYKYVKFDQSKHITIKENMSELESLESDTSELSYYILVSLSEAFLAYLDLCDEEKRWGSIQLIKGNVDSIALYVKCGGLSVNSKYTSMVDELKREGIRVQMLSSASPFRKDSIVNLLYNYFILVLDLTNTDNKKYASKTYLSETFYPRYIDFRRKEIDK